ncbi:MAG: hypothetical protein PHE10_06205 [Kiritimatiellae bacterium]|nr:hypothetical protein [Kiritimatiellia bacterium]
MKSKTVLVFLFSFGSAVTALAVSKPAPDVLFLPFNQQPSSQNVYADDGATRFWYYVGASLLSAADTQTRINSAAGKFGGTYAFRGASAADTAMKSIGGTSGTGMGAKTWGSVSPAVASNGWQHVAVCFCRTNGWNATPRVWVNGSEVEMAVVVNQTDGTLTALTNSACVVQFGNRFNTAAAGTEWFAGLISDVRFMFRELGGGEAKRLALGPPNHAPVIENTGEMFFQTFNVKKMPVSVTDDGLPSGAALTYGWSALGDNASGVTFADSSALDTSVHLPGNGVYRLSLEASDGESASEEVFDATVHVRGFLIQIR